MQKLFVGAFVLVLMGGGAWSLWTEYSFNSAALPITAAVTYGPIRMPKTRTEDKYRFGYEYTVAGRTHVGSGSSDFPPARHVTVYYLVANPASSRVRPPELVTGWIMLALGGAFGAWVIRETQRERRAKVKARVNGK